VPSNNSLGLSIPSLHAVKDGSFETNPKKVADWISNLPMTNLGEMARDVFSALTEINQLDIPIMTRFKVIELFRKCVSYMLNNLEKHFIGTPFPLPDKARKVAHLCRKLDMEMATTYKIIIEQLLSQQGEKLDKKLMIMATHRCMRYLGRIIYQSVIVYEPSPKDTWKEMHRIYLFAEKSKLHTVGINEPENKSNPVTSIEEIYKRILLLTMINPNHLRQQETQQACQFIEKWGKNTHILEVNNQSQATHQFFVNLLTDMPVITQLPQSNQQWVRAIDVRAVVQQLKVEAHTNIASTEEISHAGHLLNLRAKKELLNKLITTLSSSKKRDFARKESLQSFHSVIGLIQAYDILDEAHEREKILREAAKQSNVTDPFATNNNSEDWFDQTYAKKIDAPANPFDDISLSELSIMPKDGFFVDDLPSQQENIFLNGNKPKQQNAVVPENKVIPLQCDAVNESAGGYCFKWSEGSSAGTKIGELIVIMPIDQPLALRVGVIRWIKHPIGKPLQFGVEMIAPSATEAKVRSSGNQTQSKGLLLPAIPVAKQKASILVSTMQFETNQKLVVITKQEEMQIQLEKSIESTSAFNRFEYAVTETTRKNTDSTAQENNTDEEDDLDSLWSML
jgi:cyclic-di-GMP-binding protein